MRLINIYLSTVIIYCYKKLKKLYNKVQKFWRIQNSGEFSFCELQNIFLNNFIYKNNDIYLIWYKE